jgi:hypothetical protein
MAGGYHPQKNTEQFIAEATLKHFGRYTYEKTVYVRSSDKVIVTCSDHGDFEIRASKHLLGQKCRACANADHAANSMMTASEFVEKASKVHGNKYDYSKVAITEAYASVVVGCREHGDFTIRATGHLMGRGCTDCGLINSGKKRRLTLEDVLKKSKEVHGERYDYSNTVYVDKASPMEIGCRVHGSFWLDHNHHSQGRGCPKCSWNGAGFDTAKPASLYILTCGDITKVGITNRAVAARVHGINRASGLEFKAHTSIFSEDGGFIRRTEQKTLTWLRSKYKTVDKKFDGYTECFMSVDMEELLEFISPNDKTTEAL